MNLALKKTKYKTKDKQITIHQNFLIEGDYREFEKNEFYRPTYDHMPNRQKNED